MTAVEHALKRLRDEQLHDRLCPLPDEPCTCQHIADLALVTAHLDAGARGERARVTLGAGVPEVRAIDKAPLPAPPVAGA